MELGKKVCLIVIRLHIVLYLNEFLFMLVCMQVFTSWVNYELAHKKVKVNNIETDFSDGSVLITLAEVLLNKQVDVSLMPTIYLQYKYLSYYLHVYLSPIRYLKPLHMTPENTRLKKSHACFNT